MRRAIPIGLLAVAAVAGAMLFLAGGVLGGAKETTACAVNEALCETGNVLAGYTGGELLVTGRAEGLTFLGGSFKVTCGESTATSRGSGVSSVEITALTFSSCGVCKVTALKTPYKGEGAPTSSGNGKFTVPVTLTSTCLGIPCVYGSEKATFEGLGSSTEPVVLAKEVSLSKLEGGGSCPSSISWTAKYVITGITEKFVEGETIEFEQELPLAGFIVSENE